MLGAMETSQAMRRLLDTPVRGLAWVGCSRLAGVPPSQPELAANLAQCSSPSGPCSCQACLRRQSGSTASISSQEAPLPSHGYTTQSRHAFHARRGLLQPVSCVTAIGHRALTSSWGCSHAGSFLACGTHQQLRLYHPQHYGSKLRGREIAATTSLYELQRVVRSRGRLYDHINAAQLLGRLQRVVLAEAAGGSSRAGSAAVQGPASRAASHPASQPVVKELLERAVVMIRKNMKWFDPRHVAAVVSSTAGLRHTDPALLDGLVDVMLARMDEAYSKDLVLLLQGLHRHRHAPSQQLCEGVQRFLLAKLPTGRMPPDAVTSLARSLLHTPAGVSPALASALAKDLSMRLPVYSPKALAGLLSVLAALPKQAALPDGLLHQSMQHMQAYATEHAHGGTILTFLSGAARLAAHAEGEVSAWAQTHKDAIQHLYTVLAKDTGAMDIERLPALAKALTLLGQAGAPPPPPAVMTQLRSVVQAHKELIVRMPQLAEALKDMYAVADGSQPPVFLRSSGSS